MKENPEEQPEEIQLERPLECSECKKAIAVQYTEIVGSAITQTCMCADCPELQRRLHGVPVQDRGASGQGGLGAGLACGNCGTTLNAIRVGAPLGCSHCYEVFDDVLLSELVAIHRIPARLAAAKKSAPIHIGRAPGVTAEINPSLHLLALNEALNDTLRREDYEQAAWLRDQIKALTEKPEKEKGHEGT